MQISANKIFETLALTDFIHDACIENPSLQSAFDQLSITGIASDSRFAKPGNLFLAQKGEKTHGLDYFSELAKKPVPLIFYTAPYYEKIAGHCLNNTYPEFINDVIFIPCKKAEDFKHILLSLYQSEINKLSLIGVTGTEGKTSITQFVAQALEKMEIPCGIIGTNGIGRLNHLQENTHTTPDISSLYASLETLSQQLYALNSPSNKTPLLPVGLEITSHALDQERIAGLQFSVVALSNFARDHLDYHQTLEAYKQAKLKLFTDYSYQCAVINSDDSFGQEIISILPKDQNIIAYGQSAYESSKNHHLQFLQIQHLNLSPSGLDFDLVLENERHHITSALFGHFNALNLAACAAILLSMGFKLPEIINVLAEIRTIKGRMQVIKNQQSPTVIIDYAHKPNALKQALIALRSHLSAGKLICLFGCGGDRDQGKRPLMGEIAEHFSDKVIISNDNPRTENPSEIAQQILAGTQQPQNIQCILDRKTAIEEAIKYASTDDIILIAGKGHEDYQIIGQTKHHFDDAEVVSNIIGAPTCN